MKRQSLNLIDQFNNFNYCLIINLYIMYSQFTIAMGIIHCIYGLAVGNVANDEHNQPHPTRFFSFSFDSESFLYGLQIFVPSTNEVRSRTIHLFTIYQRIIFGFI